MIFKQLTVGDIQENCYLIANDDQQALIVDPGAEPDKIIATLDHHNWHPVAIVLTHAHGDHIGAVEALRQHYHIPLYQNEKERLYLSNPMWNLSHYMGAPITIAEADGYFTCGKINHFGPFACRVEAIPGHSPGSSVFIFDTAGFVVVGDTLFRQSIGRTDLPGSSSQDELVQGIRRHLLTLPDEMQVLPGHGAITTIGMERAHNPYVNG